MTKAPDTARQRHLEKLAQKAWPDAQLEVVAPYEGYIHIWNHRGDTVFHVEHPLADELLAVAAREVGALSVGAALDTAEFILRTRAREHGIDVAGLRSDGVVLWRGQPMETSVVGTERTTAVDEATHYRAWVERVRPPGTPFRAVRVRVECGEAQMASEAYSMDEGKLQAEAWRCGLQAFEREVQRLLLLKDAQQEGEG